MAVFNLSVVLTTSGASVTGPTVSVGDSITLTATASGQSGNADAFNPSNCTGQQVTLGTAKALAITSFSGSSYSIGYLHINEITTSYSVTITGTVGTATDNTPNAFDVPDVPNATPSALTYSIPQTITGMDAGTACSISGYGSPQLQVAGGSNPWVTSSTISPGQTINVRLTASNLFSTPLTATLTIGTVTDTITVTTTAEPSGGTGGEISGGTSAYGIKVYDTNGATSVLSPATRYMTRLTGPTSVSVPPNGGSVLIPCNMAGLTSSNSTLIVVEIGTADYSITLESTGFRFTNNSTGTFNNKLYAVRF